MNDVAQLYADKMNAEAQLAAMTKERDDLAEENAMLLRDGGALKCDVDARTNCTGCPECRA